MQRAVLDIEIAKVDAGVVTILVIQHGEVLVKRVHRDLKVTLVADPRGRG
jgi:hypothetical protein